MSRVLGLGAAKQGSDHWWSQRLTSAALVILSAWFVISLLGMERRGYAEFIGWISSPLNAGLMVLLILALMYHSQLGVQVVLEDYVSHKGGRVVALVLNQFAHMALGVLALLAVLRIVFGSPA